MDSRADLDTGAPLECLHYSQTTQTAKAGGSKVQGQPEQLSKTGRARARNDELSLDILGFQNTRAEYMRSTGRKDPEPTHRHFF